MGTTFVTITEGTTGDEPGFWMTDGMLSLWLRLLALHLPEPTNLGEHAVAPEIRNRWLLASAVHFGGCVPHEMEFAAASPERQIVVRKAIESLMAVLDKSDAVLNADTINLLGIEGRDFFDIDRAHLKDIGYAFLDLLDGRIESTARSTEVMPGSKPYRRDGDRTKR
jgi:hypothetical protein